jgi:hypothetical protein
MRFGTYKTNSVPLPNIKVKITILVIINNSNRSWSNSVGRVPMQQTSLPSDFGISLFVVQTGSGTHTAF